MRFLLPLLFLLSCSPQEPEDIPWILEVIPAEMESSLIQNEHTYGQMWAQLRQAGGSMVREGRYFVLVRRQQGRAQAFIDLYSPFTRWAAENHIEQFRLYAHHYRHLTIRHMEYFGGEMTHQEQRAQSRRTRQSGRFILFGSSSRQTQHHRRRV